MKNRLPAVMVGLAIQGFACAAHAQSSVTLFGVIDTAIDISKQGNGLLVRELSGGTMGSRWGLQGNEDLGGGWATIFTVEDGFGINNGAIQQGGVFFGRQAWVGLRGTPGTFTAGRQYSPEFWAFASNDAFNGGLAGGLPNIWRVLPNGSQIDVLNAYAVTARTNNSVVYTSPVIYGVTLRAMYAFGGVAGSMRDGSTMSFSANYSGGALALNAGYLKSVNTAGSGEWIAWSAGGNYTFGPARVFVAYTRDTDTTGDIATTTPGSKVQFSLANIGLQYQISPYLQAIAQVTRLIDTSDGLAASQNAYVEAVGLNYSLSKRTSFYASYGQVQNKHGSTYSLGGAVYTGGIAAPDATGRSIQIGMRTLF
ncbi:porin [Paraburkholderia domus]|uniref:Outer membrane porin protein n=1 Tax=Paraburkholderia domus TaxID=2793075 RepID=A0A9N8N8J4_9BURK|nr:porin [Paraburkholderia domus]MBK5053731.1 porin [Burkholderia sp. R-70006]MBK5065619.1 porin [Burkholderia sp. R-70199]MBK5122233.1 porin [Burkholderia sp. R-69980]MBK5169766.1 porin [Burkholderia sp. R-70211]MBK5185259.1 porin [Burkholderia sp. R-69749]